MSDDSKTTPREPADQEDAPEDGSSSSSPSEIPASEDPFDGLDDWDDIFDSLHEADNEPLMDAQLHAAHKRDAEATRSGQSVLNRDDYVLPSVLPEALPEALPDAQLVPVPEGESTPEPEGESTPEPEGESTPVPEGESTPVPEGDVEFGGGRVSSPAPLAGTPFEPSVDELDDFLDFGSGAEALGDLLGAPPPLPPMPGTPTIPTIQPGPPGTMAQDIESGESTASVPAIARGPEAAAPEGVESLGLEMNGESDDLYTSAPRAALAPAPTDDELFGNLPEQLPEPADPEGVATVGDATQGADPMARTRGDDQPEATRIADLGAMQGLVAESARDAEPVSTDAHVPRTSRRPSIVRRLDLERQRREALDDHGVGGDFGGGDFDGGEATRIADVAAIDELARSEAEAAKAAADAAEAFFSDSGESLEFELDGDFYDDIEIADSDSSAATHAEPAAESSAGETAEAIGDVGPDEKASPRRTTAHIVRRARTEPPPEDESEIAVVEFEADFEGEHDDDFGDAFQEFAHDAEPVDLNSALDGIVEMSDAVRSSAQSSEVSGSLEEAPSAPPLIEEPAVAEEPAVVEEPADAAEDNAGGLEEVDVAPELPAGTFGTELPVLATAELKLPTQVDLSLEDRSEEWAANLLVFEREIETVDELAPLSRLRVEAGRLCEQLGDLERARLHYEEALVADPRLVPAMRGLRRAERGSERWPEAIAALEEQLIHASPMERRALQSHRADLLAACGERELARVAVGDLLTEAPGDVRALLADLEDMYVEGSLQGASSPPEPGSNDVLLELAQQLVDPELSAALRELRGRLAAHRGDARQAASEYLAAIEIAGARGRGRWPLVRVQAQARLNDGAAVARDAALLAEGDAEAVPALWSAVCWRNALRSAASSEGDKAAAAKTAMGILDRASLRTSVIAQAAVELATSNAAAAGSLEQAKVWKEAASVFVEPAARATAERRAARAFSAAAQPEAAAAALMRANALDSTEPSAATALRDALTAAGDPGGLLEFERTALSADSGDDYARIALAHQQQNAGETAAAIATLREGIDAATAAGREPGYVLIEAAAQLHAAHAVLGDSEADGAARSSGLDRAKLLTTFAESEQVQRTSLVANRAAARATTDIALRALEALHASADGAPKPEEVQRLLHSALELWHRVTDLEPEETSAHAAVCAVAAALGDSDLLQRALLVAQAAERQPAAMVAIALRRVDLLLGGADADVEAAEDALREADALAPGDPRASLPLLLLAIGAGRWADAAQILEERAAQLDNSPEAAALRFRAAAIMLDQGDEPARAIELLGPVIDAVPDFSAATELQAAAHRRLGDASALAANLDQASHRAGNADVAGARGDAFALLVREAELLEFQVGDPAKAVDTYAKALEIRPSDPLARDGFVRAAAAAGEAAPVAALALADLKRAEELEDSHAKADAYEELGRIDAELRGDYGSALLSWEAAAAAAPKRYLALRILEQTYLREGRNEDLYVLYSRQLDALGGSIDAVAVAIMRARIADALGRSSTEVLANYRRARAVEGKRADNREALFRLEVAALEAGPSEERAELELAIARYFSGRAPAETELSSSSAVAGASFQTRAGETFHQLGDVDRAIEIFRDATAAVVGGHVPALEAWSRSAIRGELWLDVAAVAQQRATAAAYDADRAALHHLAGVALMDKALQGERAVEPFRMVLSVDPSHNDAFLRLRILFDEQGQHEDLAQLLNQRLEVETEPVALVELHRALAELHRNFLDDRDGAIAHLKQIRQIDPHSRWAVASLADIAWERGDWAHAAEMLIERARLETDTALLKAIFHRLGTIYSERLPDLKWALSCYQKVLTYDATDRSAWNKLSELAVRAGDWKTGLAACERLIKSATNPQETIPYWHRVAGIYATGLGDKTRAEQAYRRALDIDPANDAALDALVGFYEQSGDTRSMRVHLDRVAAHMRKRISDEISDVESRAEGTSGAHDAAAYAVLSRVLEAREKAGVKGSTAVARCAAELSLLFGGGVGGRGERLERLAAHAAQVKPPLATLGKGAADDMFFPRAVSGGLREVMHQLGGRLTKHLGVDLRRYGVGRGDRQRGTETTRAMAEIATEFGADGVELYLSSLHPQLLVAEPSSPVTIVLGTELASALSPAGLRFVTARSLVLARTSLAVLARMTSEDLGVVLCALVRQFQPDYELPGISTEAVESERQRMKRLIPASMHLELRPFVLGIAGSGIDHNQIWAGLQAAGDRAGLLACGSVTAALQVSARSRGYSDLASALSDPTVKSLLRFAVSEEHTALRGALGG